MAKLEQQPTVSVEARLILSESEMRALDALRGYGVDAFLRVFYKEMGRSYLGPHEAGLRSLLESTGGVSSILERFDAAKVAFQPKTK